jgi:polysaccharide export outer membrane protein
VIGESADQPRGSRPKHVAYARKEQTVSLATWISSVRPTLKTASAVLLFSVVGTGCLDKGLLDQTELGRFKQDRLVSPILNTLPGGDVEELDPRFANAQDVRPDDLRMNATDYTIGASDFISISIFDLVAPGIETVKNVRVSESGNISLPQISPIKAAGLTEAQLEKAIRDAYRDEQIIQNANVTVTVFEARARSYSVLGQVDQPGEFAIIKADYRILDALVQARIRSTVGIENIYIVRRAESEEFLKDDKEAAPDAPPSGTDPLTPRSQGNSRNPLFLSQDDPMTPPATQPGASDRVIQVEGRTVPIEQNVPDDTTMPSDPPPVTTFNGFAAPVEPTDMRIIRVPVQRLMNGELKFNIVLRPRDMIIVPEPIVGEYYMGGHVQRTGVYSMTARQITLKQAIMSAGMLDQIAVPWRTQIVRRIPGKDQEVYAMVDLTKIFAGVEPDIYIRKDDQILVGTQAWAPFLAAIRNGFRFAYGFGFFYDRNFNAVTGGVDW